MTADDETEEVDAEPEVAEESLSSDEESSVPSEEIAEMRSELDELREKVRARTAQLRAEAKARSQQTEVKPEPESTVDMASSEPAYEQTPETETVDIEETDSIDDADSLPVSEDSQDDSEPNLSLSDNADLSESVVEEEFDLDEVAQTVEDELTDIEPEIEQTTSSSVTENDLNYDVNIIDERQLDDNSTRISAMYPASDEQADSPLVDAAEQATSDVEQYFSEDELDIGEPVNLVDPKSAVSDMWQDLTEEPLPSDDDLDQMFKEIKDLENASDNEEGEDDEDVDTQQQDRLQSILSSIPSFSQMNKKKDED